MNRSSFLKKLLGSLVIGNLPLSITQEFRKIYLLQFFVAGFRHYDGMQHLTGIKEGDLIELVREPNNEYDSCAIALHWQGKKIGFIPADVNEMLSYLIDVDALSLFGVVTHLQKNAQPWENVAAAVYFVQEVNKNLPAHANHLTKIEAPHYRTLNKKAASFIVEDAYTLEDLFDETNRVINLDTIPSHHSKAKDFFKNLSTKHTITINGNNHYVLVPTDDIYTFMYNISDEIKCVKDINGVEYMEFFLV